MRRFPRLFVFFASALLFVSGFAGAIARADENASGPTLELLKAWIKDHALNDETLSTLPSQPFAATALTSDEAQQATAELWNSRTEFLKKTRQAEFDDREIVIDDLKMPFWYKVFGEAPAEGRSLFISMHGGGGAPAEVNDQQYENQKRLYQPEEGVYLVPRAATNTWDLWHQAHIDPCFERLITDMILYENVNPDRVYIMGYSAGGDGVYQLAPRMADRLAAAAMMAGHPNESRPDGLRNIGFTIHMGANDDAYNRNAKAEEWGKLLDALQAGDKDGYIHEVSLHKDRGHWMNLEDAVAVPWMARFTRNVWPKRIAWVQDDVRHARFYWLGVSEESAKAGDRIVASVNDNEIFIEHCDAKAITLLLSDSLLNLDNPVTVKLPSGATSQYEVKRTIADIARSLAERYDRPATFSATIQIPIGESE
ncbi:MAG: dienelactone hydrolase family protein [Fuerstia sp.]|nr:dienelactone hydrolase family protein [Fuerstiella sp.]